VYPSIVIRALRHVENPEAAGNISSRGKSVKIVTEKQIVKTSKFLSLILRHEPHSVGLKLDTAGWASVNELLEAVNRHGVSLTLEELRHLVATNDKKRFAFSDDGQRIRASQGHSVAVDLQYQPEVPPESLYHGTPQKFVESIRASGLNKGERHDAHLSPDPATATRVGQRRGKPIALKIRAGEMHRAGHAFRRTANNVWLVDFVPAEFIEFPS
jgi:putative RNA 2'-phosphotransferase